MTADMTPMTVSQTAELLSTVAIPLNIPTMMWGPPGVGKTELTGQVCDELGKKMIDVRLNIRAPEDMRGLPIVDRANDTVRWAAPSELPFEGSDHPDDCVIFLDEINTAPPAMQVVGMQLVHERRCGEHKLKPGVRIIAAGNRQSDRAAANRMGSALANRFMHVEVAADLDGWCVWALKNNVPAELVAFLRLRPKYLHQFDPNRIVNPTPRTWVMASRVVHTSVSQPVMLATLTGLVGQGYAAEFMSFLKMYRQLPNPDAILLNPGTADVPTQPDVMYATMGALAAHVTESKMGALCQYIERMPPEYGVCAMKDAIAAKPELVNTHGYIEWASANSAAQA